MSDISEKDKRIYTMEEEKPIKAVLKMGIPVTIGMLFMVFYNLVDTYFIGMLHDDYQLAAANLAYPIMMITVALSAIVASGGASYIARCLGNKDHRAARHTLTICFEMILIGAVIITVGGLLLINPIVTLLGAKENSFDFTKQYVFVMLVGTIFTMGNYAVGQLMRSEGSTMQSMIGMIAGTVANIILDPIFIFTLKMEIKGAAIATVLGNAIGVIVMLGFYAGKKTLLQPSRELLHFDKKIVLEILWVGIPHTLEQLFTTIAFVVNNNLAAGYGELTVAAMGVANKLMSFGSYTYQGLTAGCQPLIGYNFGAKNYKRMRTLIRTGIMVTIAVELCIVCIYGFFAPVLIGLFTESEMVIEAGIKTLRAVMLYLPFVGTTALVRNTYNAIGKPIHSFVITFVRQLVLYVPFLLLFNYLWGFTGLIHAQPAEEFLCMLLALALFSKTMKQLEK